MFLGLNAHPLKISYGVFGIVWQAVHGDFPKSEDEWTGCSQVVDGSRGGESESCAEWGFSTFGAVDVQKRHSHSGKPREASHCLKGSRKGCYPRQSHPTARHRTPLQCSHDKAAFRILQYPRQGGSQ